jgi:hypothetical protein
MIVAGRQAGRLIFGATKCFAALRRLARTTYAFWRWTGRIILKAWPSFLSVFGRAFLVTEKAWKPSKKN